MLWYCFGSDLVGVGLGVGSCLVTVSSAFGWVFSLVWIGFGPGLVRFW